jgi:hypothetical protein
MEPDLVLEQEREVYSRIESTRTSWIDRMLLSFSKGPGSGSLNGELIDPNNKQPLEKTLYVE